MAERTARDKVTVVARAGPNTSAYGSIGASTAFCVGLYEKLLCNYVGRLAVGSQPHLNQLRIFSSDSVVADYVITTMIVISLLH